jgi:uncharacterized membrane protein
LIAGTVTFDSTLKFVHVVLAIVAVGCNVSYGLWLAAAGSAGEGDTHVLRGMQGLQDRVFKPALILLILTGVVLVVRGPWGFSTPWVAAGTVLSVLAAAAALLGWTPAVHQQVAALARHGVRSTAYRVASRRAAWGAAATGATMVAVVFLMVTKPG